MNMQYRDGNTFYNDKRLWQHGLYIFNQETKGEEAWQLRP